MKTVRVKTSDVIPNPNNPRRVFDRIEELAASFDANGAHPGEPFTPPILVKDGSHYMIIDGERRFRAMRFLGLEEFTALVADDMDEADSYLAMVATNDKQHLTDEEKSRGIQKMLLLGIDPVKVDKASGIKGAARAKAAIQMAGSKAETMSIDHLLAIEETGGDQRLIDCKEVDWQSVLKRIQNEREAEERAQALRDAIAAQGGTVVDDAPDRSEWSSSYVASPDAVEVVDGCLFTIKVSDWSGNAWAYRWTRREEQDDPERERIMAEAEMLVSDLMAVNRECDSYQALNVLTDRDGRRHTAGMLLDDYLDRRFGFTDTRRDMVQEWVDEYDLPAPSQRGLGGVAGLVTWFEVHRVASIPSCVAMACVGDEGAKVSRYDVDAARKLVDKVRLAMLDGFSVPKEACESWMKFRDVMEGWQEEGDQDGDE